MPAKRSPLCARTADARQRAPRWRLPEAAPAGRFQHPYPWGGAPVPIVTRAGRARPDPPAGRADGRSWRDVVIFVGRSPRAGVASDGDGRL